RKRPIPCRCIWQIFLPTPQIWREFAGSVFPVDLPNRRTEKSCRSDYSSSEKRWTKRAFFKLPMLTNRAPTGTRCARGLSRLSRDRSASRFDLPIGKSAPAAPIPRSLHRNGNNLHPSPIRPLFAQRHGHGLPDLVSSRTNGAARRRDLSTRANFSVHVSAHLRAAVSPARVLRQGRDD